MSDNLTEIATGSGRPAYPKNEVDKTIADLRLKLKETRVVHIGDGGDDKDLLIKTLREELGEMTNVAKIHAKVMVSFGQKIEEATALQRETDKLHVEEAEAWKREMEEADDDIRLARAERDDFSGQLVAVSLKNARLRRLLDNITREATAVYCLRAEPSNPVLRVAMEQATAALAAPADGLGERWLLFARNVRALKAGDEVPVSLLQETDALLAELGARP